MPIKPRGNHITAESHLASKVHRQEMTAKDSALPFLKGSEYQQDPIRATSLSL